MPKALDNSTNLNLFFLFLIGNFLLPQTVLSQEIQFVVPQQINNSAGKKDVFIKEQFYPYPFYETAIQLADFQRKNPTLDLPESIEIVLPNMEGIRDTSLLIGYLTHATANKGYLVVLVVGNYDSNEVTFFADTNFDHDYRNDKPPLILVGGAGSESIFLQPPSEEPLKLSLSVPKRLSRIDQKLKELDVINRKFKIKVRGLAISVSLGIGTGKLNYDYDDLTIDYPVWYRVNFTERMAQTTLSYDWQRFRIDLNAGLFGYYYYTSYLNKRLTEPRGVRTGVLTERNIDNHPLNRLNLGATVAYKFNISRLGSLNPFFTYGQSIYLADQYFLDSRPNKEVAYNLSPDRFLEYGLQLEFAVANQQAFTASFSRNQLAWEPDNFLEGIALENLAIKHWVWKIGVGYKYAFFR